jgi:hypothetical protein
MPTLSETHELLAENGYTSAISQPSTSHIFGRLDLTAGPVVTLYSTGRALVQGKCLDEHGTNIATLLRAAGWKVK